MKYCYLHLGFHKTATSSIQYTLYKNRARLQEAGICFPVFYTQHRNFFNHSLPLSLIFNAGYKTNQSFTRSRLNFSKAYPHFKHQFNKLLQCPQHLLISGEDLSNLDLTSLENLKTSLLNHGFKIKVIVVVREPFSLLPSNIQQSVKAGFRIKKILKGFAAKPSALLNKVTRLKKVFEDICWLDFDCIINHKDGPTSALLERLAIKTKPLKHYKQNTTSSMASVRLLDGINKTPLLHQNKLNFTRKFDDNIPLTTISGRPFKLLLDEISPIYQLLITLRETLENACSLQFITTIKPLSDYPKEPFHWSNVELDSLLNIIPLLNDAMLYRVYDYFFSLCKKNELCQRKLENIGWVIEKEIKLRSYFIYFPKKIYRRIKTYTVKACIALGSFIKKLQRLNT